MSGKARISKQAIATLCKISAIIDETNCYENTLVGHLILTDLIESGVTAQRK